MPLTTEYVTTADYDRLYAQEAGWEYWFGQVRRKPVPTELHGILQLLLGALLRAAGYRASSETELRIVPDWFPRPDVSGITGRPVERYPTQPIDVVFEVLSEGEDAAGKCRLYSGAGIPQIFYFNPERQEIHEWKDGSLLRVTSVKLLNGAEIMGDTIWNELTKEVNRWRD